MELMGIISEDDLHETTKRYLGRIDFVISNVDVSVVGANDLIGFLGDYFRIKLKVSFANEEKTLTFFVKTLPNSNEDKRNFILDNRFFDKEIVVYNEIFKNCKGGNEPYPWRPKLLHSTDSAMVMVDLTTLNFKSIDKRSCMDLDHCLSALCSLAKFHANSIIFEHRKKSEFGASYQISSEYPLLVKRSHFDDGPWFRVGIKASLDFLEAFSKKFNSKTNTWDRIMKTLPTLFLEACHRLDKSNEHRNVVLHTDLWSNNMMFRYNDKLKCIGTALLDFQGSRYGPYGTDISGFIYLNTNRLLRGEQEQNLLKHYYKVLNDELIEETEELKESWENVRDNFEHCRIFGLLQASMIFPYINMDGAEAQVVFNDPETFTHLNEVNRSDKIIATATNDTLYKDRLLEVLEEFIERYI